MRSNRTIFSAVFLLLVLGAFAGANAQWGPSDNGLGGGFYDNNAGGQPGGFFDQQPSPPKVTVSGQFTRATAQQPAMLFITAEIIPGWHIYSITQAAGGPVTTQIKLDPSNEYRLAGPFTANPAPDKKIEPIFDNLEVETHHDKVTWSAPIEFAPGVDPSAVTIRGNVVAQLCDPSSCLPPEPFPFQATLGIRVPGAQPAAGPTAPSLADGASGGPGSVETAGGQSPDQRSLLVLLALAFVGGLALNVMPCVLPVISLKLLAFVQQAGEHRGRVFALNLWYTAGLMTVFMVLAFLAAGANQAWGEHFQLPWFKVILTALVFVMALSFLGVWEIPIPGFVGGGRAGKLQSKEGPAGAFFTGVFATVLATPCVGPFLGPLFGLLMDKPPQVTYLVFAGVGLGMASPYLVVGAFPELIRFLPKPGAWMETFKNVMAFLLLGTVVYLVNMMLTEESTKYVVPTLTLLVGLWFACWWIGRTPITASDQQKKIAWIGSGISVLLVGVFAFTILMQEPKIPWKPFSPAALAAARAEGKTVMVDFTANWCPNCITNFKVAIDTERVKRIVADNNVTPLLADMSDHSPEIKQVLNDLGHNAIPVLAIWPAGGSDDDVIVYSGILTESDVVGALEQAGPSRQVVPVRETAAAAVPRY